MRLTTLEIRMLAILRKNAVTVNTTSGKYKAALSRLVKKGMARLTSRGYELSARGMLR